MFDAWAAASVFLIPIVGSIALFTFLGVAVWVHQRRREREAFYRHELARKAVEQGSLSEEKLLEIVQGESRARWRKRIEGLKLGGLVNLALGIGILVGLRFLGGGIWQVGWIPVAVGVAFLAYAFLAPREPAPR